MAQNTKTTQKAKDAEATQEAASVLEGRTIGYLPLADIAEDPANPKDHHLGSIQDSVGRFGFLEPIVIDGRTNKIVSGHGRLASLRALHDETPEALPEGIRTGEDGSWLVPVVEGWSSQDDAQARGALVALNRTNELGGWVDEALLDVLNELSGTDEGLTGTGYDEDALENLRTWVDHFEDNADGDDDDYSDLDRDLDAMEDEYGSMTAEDKLMRVVIKLPAKLAGRLSAVLERAPSVNALAESWVAEAEQRGDLEGLDGTHHEDGGDGEADSEGEA